MLPRPDYERLCRDFNQSANFKTKLYTFGTNQNYPYPYAKLVDTRTLLHEKTNIAVPLGVNIDIFPIDSWAKNPVSRLLQRLNIKTASAALALKSIVPDPHRARHKELLLSVGRLLVRPWTVEQLLKVIIRAATSDSVEKGPDVGVIVWGYMERVPLDYYGPAVPVIFEGFERCAPKNAHGYLAKVYGDYLTLPPEESRVSHHRYAAYEK
jgi:lipopolysaccharide cholinephosphotransferase